MKNMCILIVDDDEFRASLMKLELEHQIMQDENTDAFKEYFDGSRIERVDLSDRLDDMVDKIVSTEPDCVLVDYRLESQSTATYTGVELAEGLNSQIKQLPVFILTSYEEDLFRETSFNAYQVYDVARFFDDVDSTTSSLDNRLTNPGMYELNRKIIHQAILYRREIDSLKKELDDLLNKTDRSVYDDDRILEIDCLLEGSVDAKHALPKKLKKEICSDNFLMLLDKVDCLIQEIS